MTIEIRESPVITVRVTRPLTKPEFTETYDEVIRQPRFQAGDPILWDLTEASLEDLTYEDCREIAAHEDRRRGERGGGRCALAVSEDVDYGVSRMVQALRELTFGESQVRVFRDIGEATRWLVDDRAREGPARS